MNNGDSSSAAHAALRWVPASPAGAGIVPGLTWPPQAFTVSARPAATLPSLSTFRAAFTSRSWAVPHAAQVHSRMQSGLGPSLTPHAEHTCDVGSNRPV